MEQAEVHASLPPEFVAAMVIGSRVGITLSHTVGPGDPMLMVTAAATLAVGAILLVRQLHRVLSAESAMGIAIASLMVVDMLARVGVPSTAMEAARLDGVPIAAAMACVAALRSYRWASARWATA